MIEKKRNAHLEKSNGRNKGNNMKYLKRSNNLVGPSIKNNEKLHSDALLIVYNIFNFLLVFMIKRKISANTTATFKPLQQ